MVVDSVASGTRRANLAESFTAEQEDLIRATCCGGASKADADVLILDRRGARAQPGSLGECYRRALGTTPPARSGGRCRRRSTRIKAEQTGLYAGQDEPEYEYDATTARLRWLA